MFPAIAEASFRPLVGRFDRPEAEPLAGGSDSRLAVLGDLQDDDSVDAKGNRSSIS